MAGRFAGAGVADGRIHGVHGIEILGRGGDGDGRGIAVLLTVARPKSCQIHSLPATVPQGVLWRIRVRVPGTWLSRHETAIAGQHVDRADRSEEHTSELQ